MHDEVLRLRVSKVARLIDFADELVVVVVSNHPSDVAIYGDETNHASKAWLGMVRLNLANEKVKAALITAIIAGKIILTKFVLVIGRSRGP